MVQSVAQSITADDRGIGGDAGDIEADPAEDV
jgi:hypothetical protein